MEIEIAIELAFGPAIPSVMAPDRLAGCFESLGDGCEFGLLQRFCGLEVLGLFRFASLPIDRLLALLEQRFAPLLDPGCVSVFVPEGSNEWWGRVAAFGINYHAGRWWTGDQADAHGEAAVLAGERRRIPFLARKLLQDLESPHKIFVRRDLGRREGEIAALAQAVRAFGDHALLWVDFTSDPGRVGTVERVGEGLARGFVGSFSAHAAPRLSETAVWLRLLQSALVLLRPDRAIEMMSLPGPARYVQVPCEAAGQAASALTGEVPPPFDGRPVIKCTLAANASDEPRAVLSASIGDLPPAEFHVVSCYVWLPRGGCGSVLLSVGDEALWTWKADADRREGWQRIATSFRGATAVHVRLMAAGCGNAHFYAAHMRIEPGTAPIDGRPDWPVTPSPG